MPETEPRGRKSALHLVRPVFREFDLCLVILFGSQVTGQTHPESDIDLGILFKGDQWQGGQGLGGQFLELYSRLSDRFPGIRLDMVDCSASLGS